MRLFRAFFYSFAQNFGIIKIRKFVVWVAICGSIWLNFGGMCKQIEFIGILCLILVTPSLAAHICRRIGVPGVVGQLLVGLIVGAGGLNLIHS